MYLCTSPYSLLARLPIADAVHRRWEHRQRALPHHRAGPCPVRMLQPRRVPVVPVAVRGLTAGGSRSVRCGQDPQCGRCSEQAAVGDHQAGLRLISILLLVCVAEAESMATVYPAARNLCAAAT
eukprot:scaffold42458_cov68-Phaeocystis_antarctica.AAC.2